MVLFDEVLDHVLRIDRIFRQPQGHLLLIGVSGAGKTTLSRFVAWMNGLSVYQIKVHNKYMASDFDEDLRAVLRRAGCKVRIPVFIIIINPFIINLMFPSTMKNIFLALSLDSVINLHDISILGDNWILEGFLPTDYDSR